MNLCKHYVHLGPRDVRTRLVHHECARCFKSGRMPRDVTRRETKIAQTLNRIGLSWEAGPLRDALQTSAVERAL